MISLYVAFFVASVAVVCRIVIIDFFVNVIPQTNEKNEGEKKNLLVGILSDPSHSKARQAIRESWGQLRENRSIEIKFLVGDILCPYPVEDRVTPYDCELWLINNPRARGEYSTVGESLRGGICDTGFSFLVKTSIVLTQIGVDSIVFSPNKTLKNQLESAPSDWARVILINSRNGKRITSATFVKNSVFGFFWKAVPDIILEEGFEGELRLESSGLDTTSCYHNLQYIAAVHYYDTVDRNGSFIPFEIGNHRSNLVGFNYTLRDISGLDEILAKRVGRFEKWELTISLIKQQLKDEHAKYGDILFLTGFIDVYSNLSYKIATFFDWVKKLNEWKFVLKTDDDVFVDLALIEKSLSEPLDIWTCIRTQTPNRAGKWRDRQSSSYPPFPSGSGYILSIETIQNMKLEPKVRLGEDVMVGMALTGEESGPLEPTCCWACGALETTCDEVCNCPELNYSQLKKLWKIYLEMNRIPSIDEM